MWKYQVLFFCTLPSWVGAKGLFVDFTPGSDLRGKLEGKSLGKFSYLGCPHCTQEPSVLDYFISCISGLVYSSHRKHLPISSSLLSHYLPWPLILVHCTLFETISSLRPGMHACSGFSQLVAQCLTHNGLSVHVKSKETPRLDFRSGIVKWECYKHDQGGKDSTQMLKSSLLTA